MDYVRSTQHKLLMINANEWTGFYHILKKLRITLFTYILFSHEYVVFTGSKISYYQISDGRKKIEVTVQGTTLQP